MLKVYTTYHFMFIISINKKQTIGLLHHLSLAVFINSLFTFYQVCFCRSSLF